MGQRKKSGAEVLRELRAFNAEIEKMLEEIEASKRLVSESKERLNDLRRRRGAEVTQ